MPITPQPGWMIDPNNPNGVVKISGYEAPVETPDDSDFPDLPPELQGGAAGHGLPGGSLYVPRKGGGGAPTGPVFSETQAEKALGLGIPRSEWGDYFGDPGYTFTNKNGAVIRGATTPSTASRVNRPVFSQNDLGGASSAGGGLDEFDDRTDAEKERDTYLSTQPKPQTEEEILAKKTEQAKSRIQANENYYASLLGDQQRTNQLRERETNAQLVMSGLAGSSEAGTKTFETMDKNNLANQKILAEKAVNLANIYADIQDSVEEELKQQKEDYIGGLDKRVEIEGAREKKASDSITLLAKSGFDFEKNRQSKTKK